MATSRVRAGRLRHRVEIQSFTESQDSSGEPSKTWSTEATVWAAIEPFVGKEAMDAGKIEARMTHKIRLRSRDGLTPDKRIKFGTRIFDIVSAVDVMERNHEMVVMAVEVLT